MVHFYYKLIRFCSAIFTKMKKQPQSYNRIKAWLAMKQVKNKTLAQFLDVSGTTVSKWCTNSSQPSIQQLYRIANFLQISVYKLLEPNMEDKNDL